MSDGTVSGWPRFELVTFPKPNGVPPELARALVERGVPKNLLGTGRYRAASELTLLEAPGSGQLVCFGTIMLFGKICLDPRTGQVVELTYVPPEYSKAINQPPGVLGTAKLVNSSLEQFIETVRVMIQRFPYYGAPSGLEEREVVGDKLSEVIRSIDPTALSDPNGFWQVFLEDIMNGDFATEDIVGEGDE